MAENFDGVWELRIYYTTIPAGLLTMSHRQTFDVKVTGDPVPGTSFNDIEIQQKGGTFTELDTYLLSVYLPLLDDCFNTSTEFGFAELWKIPEGTYDGLFISALELAVPGTNAVATTAAHQTTFTFRSIGGGHARIQLMEPSFSGNGSQNPPYSNAAAQALSLHVISDLSAIVARDNSFLIARIKWNDGQNEKLWRKRFRSV